MKNIYVILMLCLVFSCTSTLDKSPVGLFSNSEFLLSKPSSFDEDMLARVEGLQSNDSFLVVSDFHSGNSFTLFDITTEKYIGRFGKIGQGPGEILLGCYGYLGSKNFYAYGRAESIYRYPVQSIRSDISVSSVRLVRYQIADALFSHTIPLSDSTFLGAGVYKSEFQFAVFNKKNEVIDYKVEVFNAKDEGFSVAQKFLSNQGGISKNPVSDQFVYTINRSSNIHFIKVFDNKISLIKSICLRAPQGKPQRFGEAEYVLPDPQSPIGYINVASTGRYVYALYTDKKEGESYINSDIVLVFDWEGKPIKKYQLDKEVYHITVSERTKKMYAATKNDSGGWTIVTYDL